MVILLPDGNPSLLAELAIFRRVHLMIRISRVLNVGDLHGNWLSLTLSLYPASSQSRSTLLPCEESYLDSRYALTMDDAGQAASVRSRYLVPTPELILRPQPRLTAHAQGY